MGIIIFLLFISLSCLLYNVLTLDDGSKTGITQRLNYIKNRATDNMPEDELSTSFKERVVKPVLEGAGKAVLRLAPRDDCELGE